MNKFLSYLFLFFILASTVNWFFPEWSAEVLEGSGLFPDGTGLFLSWGIHSVTVILGIIFCLNVFLQKNRN